MRTIVRAFIVLAIVIGGLYLSYSRLIARPTSGPDLQTAAVRRGPLLATVDAAGTIQAKAQTILAFQASGTVGEVSVAPGDRVTKGQVLMKLDTTDLQLAVDQAQAALDIAQARLAQAKAGPGQQQLDAARANYDLAIAEAQVRQAQLALQQAQNNLNKALILAPYDGVVAAVNYGAGDQVGQNSPAVTLVDLSALSVEVSLSEVDIPRIQLNQPATISLDALPDRTFTGHVSYTAAAGAISQNAVSFPVRIQLDKVDSTIKPGMSASVSILVGRREDVLLVPNRAVRSLAGEYIVRTMVQGQVISVPVQLGLSNDTVTEVLKGLREGDQVILTMGPAPSPGVFFGRP